MKEIFVVAQTVRHNGKWFEFKTKKQFTEWLEACRKPTPMKSTSVRFELCGEMVGKGKTFEFEGGQIEDGVLCPSKEDFKQWKAEVTQFMEAYADYLFREPWVAREYSLIS